MTQLNSAATPFIASRSPFANSLHLAQQPATLQHLQANGAAGGGASLASWHSVLQFQQQQQHLAQMANTMESQNAMLLASGGNGGAAGVQGANLSALMQSQHAGGGLYSPMGMGNYIVGGVPGMHSALGSGVLPSLSQSAMIRDVWAQNLEEEFAVIRSLINDYPYVAMDTEFPGVVAKPVGNFKSTREFYYHTLRLNVNMLKMIQVGITLLNERGEVPEHCCTWQFNFSFSTDKDVYAKDSINLLKQGGINFQYFSLFGIEPVHFASLLISSGLVRNPDVHWLAFHAGYDFGYLTRMLYNADLPESEDEFLKRFHFLFPSAFDIKYLLRQTDYSHSFGLDNLADALKVRRFGNAHQAGSDSLLTGHCYFKLLQDYFKNREPTQGNGILYGLTEDSAASDSSSSAAANAIHHQPSGLDRDGGAGHSLHSNRDHHRQ